MTVAGAEHWDGVYTSKPETTMSWYQRSASVSLDLIGKANLGADARVVDVGAGASTLVDDLLALGTENVVLVDVSEQALAITRSRLGAVSGVEYVTTSVLELDIGPVALWHDRALFHFLQDGADRRRYVEVAAKHVVAGGYAIVAAFAQDGPTYCSGLPTARYSDEQLAAEFAPHFSLVTARHEVHHTPDGREQNFTYVLLQRHDD